MNYKDWLNRFGRSGEDAVVLARLAEGGVKKVPIMRGAGNKLATVVAICLATSCGRVVDFSW